MRDDYCRLSDEERYEVWQYVQQAERGRRITRLLCILAAILAIATLLLTPYASGAEPLNTAGDLAAALEEHPAGTPVGINGRPVILESSLGVISLSPSDPPPDPPGPDVAHRKPHGVAALQPGKQSSTNQAFPSGGRLISLLQLNDKDIAGYTIRFTPDQVKDEAGWKKIQACIDNAHKADKWYTLLPMSGGPISAASLAAYDAIDDQVARRWGNDPLFAMYHVTGVTKGASEELHWAGGMSMENENRMIARFRHARKALPGVTLCIAIGGGDDAGMRRITSECKDAGPFIVKNNNLMAFRHGNNTFQTWPDSPHNRLLVDICKSTQISIGEEMVGSTGETMGGRPRTGTRDINDSLKQMAVLAKRAGEKTSEVYVAVYPPDLAAVDASVLTEAP